MQEYAYLNLMNWEQQFLVLNKRLVVDTRSQKSMKQIHSEMKADAVRYGLGLAPKGPKKNA